MKNMSTTRRYNIFLFILMILSIFSPFPAKTAAPPDQLTELTVTVPKAAWHNFERLIDASKGSTHSGMSDLKRYFQRFGYLTVSDSESALVNFNDTFDENLESAVRHYQKNLGLVVTGKLDSRTIRQIMSPRCGVSDSLPSPAPGMLHVTKRYSFFKGRPRWSKSSPITLTYAFSPKYMIDYIDISDIREVFRKSFSRWSSVVPVNFTEVSSVWYANADVKIGFFEGDHGDGYPFDGVLGDLAHASAPEDGRLHLDAAETWAVDLKKVKSRVAVDLESVVTHEIGHILGLDHSFVEDAIMYPYLNPRTKKVDLNIDDVEGIQAIYGSNPNFKYNSSSWVVGPEKRLWLCVSRIVMVVSILFL